MNIGIFGGRFDPIHRGHLEMIERALLVHGIDKVHVVPSASPPHKPVCASFNDRCAMIQLAIDHGKLPTDRIVIDRREHDMGLSWTIDTVKSIQANYPPNHSLWLIIGEDTATQLSTWYNPKELLNIVHLLIFSRTFRPDETLGSIQHYFPNHRSITIDILFCNTASSTRYRSLKDFDQLSPAVNDYIHRRNLYQNRHPLVLGITGRVGSGKSTAVRFLSQQFQIDVLDLDIIGHRLLDQPDVFHEIKAHFGESVIDGNLISRSKLGARVFADRSDLKLLNEIIHPRIRQRVVDALSKRINVTVIVGALITELGITALCDEIWVIDANDRDIEASIGEKFNIRHSQRSRDTYKKEGVVIPNSFNEQFYDTVVQNFERFRQRIPLEN